MTMHRELIAAKRDATPQSQGGLARARSLSSLRRSEIAQAAAQARWNRQIEVVGQKRRPDCWINVHHSAGKHWYSQCWTMESVVKDLQGEAVYRLKVYLKPGVQS